MLNQLDQFFRIQTRNVGDIATGCSIDGLVGMIGVSMRRFTGLLDPAYGLTASSYRLLTAGKRMAAGLPYPHRLRYWHLPVIHWQLQQG
ncbi:hypothetical protein PN498_17300 [Oscillatoria sp. CS-180]|uniref:hypothetical protein n=1 Tax=Oscillatoria sp. CS-180 TaxID=3021720 RepID=UPI00232FFFBA|nr:hypothetical protein [Oscillatoria sp. CS-180]MDB9527755.1 hypothetical protein [Oscillatoria sp. CS-180]